MWWLLRNRWPNPHPLRYCRYALFQLLPHLQQPKHCPIARGVLAPQFLLEPLLNLVVLLLQGGEALLLLLLLLLLPRWQVDRCSWEPLRDRGRRPRHRRSWRPFLTKQLRRVLLLVVLLLVVRRERRRHRGWHPMLHGAADAWMGQRCSMLRGSRVPVATRMLLRGSGRELLPGASPHRAVCSSRDRC